jgi:hypothetical protein
MDEDESVASRSSCNESEDGMRRIDEDVTHELY